MGGAVADRGHPGLIGWSRLDPVDGGIGLDARAITPCARVGSSYLFDIAILNNDQRRDVIGIRACKVDRAWANAARGFGHQNAARIQALQTGWILIERGTTHDRAAVVRLITGPDRKSTRLNSSH